ncbi:MAG: DUF2474 family protein [Hyphomicrobiales bacterium]|nr:MAG: DUF2474 family protein [Hyphomicrobiales bacterium]
MGERANRLFWFVGIWLGGVMLVGIVAYAIRLILKG